MSTSRTATFFDGYAADFAAIYGGEHRGLNRWIDLAFRRSMRLRYERSLAACTPAAGRTVLDVGCGPGHYSVALAQNGASVIGVDFADGMIALARERAERAGVSSRCRFVTGHFEAIEAAEGFDYLVTMGVMDYVAEPRAFLARALGMTRRRAVFSFPAAGGFLAWQRQLRYRRRCALYLYEEHAIHRLLSGLGAKQVTVERISRDYFATVDMQ